MVAVVEPTVGEARESEIGGTGIGWKTRALGEEEQVAVEVVSDETESGGDPPCGAEVAVASCSREAVGTNPWGASLLALQLVKFDLEDFCGC